MPGPSLHSLTWSETQHQYELTTGGRPGHWFQQEDELSWQSWLWALAMRLLRERIPA